jgi:Tfp pilus assembly protein PilE
MAVLPTPGNAVRWLLAIAVFGVLLGVGFTYYQRLKSEEAELLAAVAQSNKTIETFRAVDLTSLQTDIDSLKSRASNANSQEAMLIQKYRAYTHSIEIQETLYSAAAETGCTIDALNCSGPSAADTAGIPFESYMVSVNASSAVPPELLSFIMKVGTYYPSGVIDSVSMEIPRPPEEDSAETVSTVSFVLRIVYAPQEVG